MNWTGLEQLTNETLIQETGMKTKNIKLAVLGAALILSMVGAIAQEANRIAKLATRSITCVRLFSHFIPLQRLPFEKGFYKAIVVIQSTTKRLQNVCIALCHRVRISYVVNVNE